MSTPSTAHSMTAIRPATPLNIHIASPPSKTSSKTAIPSSTQKIHPKATLEVPESDGECAPNRDDTPMSPAPQAWEAELADFDFGASPGVEDWMSGETSDGRAVYSNAAAGVTVEFQKWDW